MKLLVIVIIISLIKHSYSIFKPITSKNNCIYIDKLQKNEFLRLKLWNYALTIGGFPKLTKKDSSYKEKSKFISTFYNNSHGFSVFNVSGHPIIYKRIWKCSNNAIRFFFNFQKEKTNSSFYLENSKTRCYNSTFGDCRDHDYADVVNQLKIHFKVTKIPLFTFIRDPMSHFNSGFREFYYRTNLKHMKKGINSSFSSKTISISKLISILDNYLSLNSTFDISVDHTYPQTSVLNNIPVDLFGRMENFDADWNEIMSYYNLNLNFRIIGNGHASSNDPNGIDKIWHKIPLNYLRSICVLLSVDYLCLNYNFPSYCEDLMWDIMAIFTM